MIFTAALLLMLPVLLILSPQAGQSVRDGLALSFRAVLPALFPAMVLCGMIGELAESVPLPPALTVWITSHLCGFPLGIKTLSRAYHRGLLTHRQTVRLSACCSNASPAFLIAYAGEAVLGSRRAGILLFTGQLLLSLLLALLLGAFTGGRKPEPEDRALLPVVTGSIAQAALGSLTLTGYITAFAVISGLCRSVPGFDYLYGFLEISGGLAALPKGPLQLFLAAAMAGFSGLSVMLQNGAFLIEERLPLWPMFLGKCFYMICLPPFVLALQGGRALRLLWFLPVLLLFSILMIYFDKREKKGYNKLKWIKEGTG